VHQEHRQPANTPSPTSVATRQPCERTDRRVLERLRKRAEQVLERLRKRAEQMNENEDNR
jgi:hypothetical protein